jgi:hypothetical protein
MPMTYRDDMDTLFDRLEGLTPVQKDTVKYRYRFMIRDYRRRCFLFSILFYVLKITMTVGSLSVPALLSIQSGTSNDRSMYWLTWGLSLAVTTANGIMTLFKLDKRFLTLHATAERLRTETWQYIMLAGRYSGHHGHGRPTHKNQYVYYCSQLEKIHMKQIDEEYIKTSDGDKPQQPNAPAVGGAPLRLMDGTMVPSPPDHATTFTSPPPRRDSQESVRTDETQNTEGQSVPVHDSGRGVLPSADETRITVLPATSAVPTEPTVRRGTTVPATQVQPQPADPGNA